MSFIWNGVSSDTMKFNVTSRQVYNAPAYDLNAIEVPGRSGDLLNPQNRFKNKQITYTGFLKASDFEGSTWREKLSTGLIQLKGWLCSDAGTYHELTDDYDPGFTRYGYISGETAISDIEDRPFGVTLTVTFNCKPFMYNAGEPVELPETKSASGSIITITDGAENTPLKSAVVNIEPVQDLHGYDYPWPAGGGVNKCPKLTAGTYQNKGGKIVVDANGLATLSGTTTAEGNVAIIPLETPITVTSQWYVQLHNSATIAGIAANFESTTYVSSASIALTSANRIQQLAANKIGNVIDQVRFWVPSGVTLSGTFQPIFTEDATAQPYSPYSNICPISGWSQANVWVKPTYDTTLTPTATIPLGRTVYGGTLDVVRGKLVVDRAMADLGALDWTPYSSPERRVFRAAYPTPRPFIGNNALLPHAICSSYYPMAYGPISSDDNGAFSLGNERVIVIDHRFSDVASFSAAVNGVKFVYELATPQEYDLTPQTIKTLLGVNNIWADSGDTTLEYPISTESPYPFESRPLYEITMDGTGTLTVNGKEWTITDYTGTLYCDTEAMEWYDASQLRNNIVSGDGWPVFEAGENSVSYTGDITKVMVTPRWRTL